jgi:hypothetical protein
MLPGIFKKSKFNQKIKGSYKKGVILEKAGPEGFPLTFLIPNYTNLRASLVISAGGGADGCS